MFNTIQISIICIAAVEVVALLQGHNGIILTSTIASMVGLATYEFGKVRARKEA